MSGRGKARHQAINIFEQDDDIQEAENEEEVTFEDEIIVKSAVRYFIISSSRKVAVDRGTVTKFLRETHGELNKKKMLWIFTEAKKRLKDFFNLELFELYGGLYLKNNFQRSEIFVDEIIPDFGVLDDKSNIDQSENDEQMEVDAQAEEPEEEEVNHSRKKNNRRGQRKRARIESDDEENEQNESSNATAMNRDNSDEDETREAGEEDVKERQLFELRSKISTGSTAYRTHSQNAIVIPHIFGWTLKDMIQHSKIFFIKLVLAFIDLKAEPVLESELFDFLNDLRYKREMKLDSVIDPNSRTVQQFVTIDLPARGYLERMKKTGGNIGEGHGFVYQWGSRSMIEFSHAEILQFIRNFYHQNDIKEDFWVTYEMNAHEADSRIEKQRLFCEPDVQPIDPVRSQRT